MKLKQRIYDFGGSRMWLEDETGKREIVADTYAALGNEYAVALLEFTLDWQKRARRAAEIEGRKVPTREEIEAQAVLHGLLQWSGDIGETVIVDYVKFALVVLARFGGREIEGREVESGAAMTCSLLAQYQSEVDVIESVAGFTDESTPVGEAWARICGVLARFGGGEGE